MKRSTALVFAGLLLVASGCTEERVRQGDDVPYPPPAEIECEGDPVRYDDISERFSIVVCPTRIVADRGSRGLEYRFGVTNQSDDAYRDLRILFIPNPELDPYLRVGAIELPSVEMNLAPRGVGPGPDEGVGIDAEFPWELIDDDEAIQWGLDMSDAISLAERFEVELVWKSGEERHQLSSPVVDATSS